MRKIIISILVLIIIICSGIIVHKFYLYNKDEKSYEVVKELKPTVIVKEGNEVNDEVENELLKINNDYKFWINIDNTIIDYPVVQCNDNNFYLNKDFYKKDSISGCLFVDYRNNIVEDENIIIYGHNMRNGTMFNDINKFKDESFFTNNKIKIIMGKDEKVYEVFSVYVTSADELNLKNKFESDSDYLQYLNELSSMSLFNKEISIDSNREIVTLISCSYEYNDARVVVHGIK